MTSAVAQARSRTALALILTLGSTVACGSNKAAHDKTPTLLEGQTDFVSAPPNGSSQGNAEASDGAGFASSGGSASNAPSPSSNKGADAAAAPRTVEETDLYR